MYKLKILHFTGEIKKQTNFTLLKKKRLTALTHTKKV
jgi:hypothetical protein